MWSRNYGTELNPLCIKLSQNESLRRNEWAMNELYFRRLVNQQQKLLDLKIKS